MVTPVLRRVLWGGLIVALSACSKGASAPDTEDGPDVPPQLTFQKLEFRIYRGPELAAEGRAAQASFRRDTGEVVAERIVARFPEEPSRPATRIEAGHGEGNVRERRFAGSAGVKAVQGSQVSTTAEARWSAADGIIRGDEPVVVRRGRLVVRGPGFTINPKDQRLVIDGGAHAVAGGR